MSTPRTKPFFCRPERKHLEATLTCGRKAFGTMIRHITVVQLHLPLLGSVRCGLGRTVLMTAQSGS